MNVLVCYDTLYFYSLILRCGIVELETMPACVCVYTHVYVDMHVC